MSEIRSFYRLDGLYRRMEVHVSVARELLSFFEVVRCEPGKQADHSGMLFRHELRSLNCE